MKRICERGLNWFQVYNDKGDVRLCGWLKDSHIGNLLDNTVEEIYHGEQAVKLREHFERGDYSLCNLDACSYLAQCELEHHMIEYEEVPKYPSELYLGFERVCNYACTSCTVHQCMMDSTGIDLEKYYSKIEERLEPLLPHIKKISANGCGELFCSKHTLRMLANWKPLADPSEVEVILESNGSLFDEKHWKQIENLGQYYLKVEITVMSFDEPVYQYLSGTNLPISVIENNLRFIKGLREKGIVNYFEIATVVQEQNFRQIPEFAKRCIEEFGADYVRLRPYEPWGAQSPEESWFTDIRNPEHPYYREYKKVMGNPILQHPSVHDWSGGLDTVNKVMFPYKISHYKWQIVSEICENMEGMLNKLKNYSESKKIVIYGIAAIGKILTKELLVSGYDIPYIIDQNSKHTSYMGINIYALDETEKMDKDIIVIITPLIYDQAIFEELKKHKFQKFISIKELISNQKLSEEMKGI